MLRYDPETGEWTWLKRSHGGGNARPGDKAGSLNLGRVIIAIDGCDYKSSRLAWLYMTGRWPTLDVDHRDGNPRNDSWANLREATDSQNTANKKRPSNNSSGFKGVCWAKDRRKWGAQIGFHYRKIHLGFFDTPEAAHEAYKAKARELFGEYARFQ
jgi:hypothetical protein